MALAAGEGLAAVGVEAVVEGLKGFQSAFSFMNDQMDSFAGKGSFLSKAFAPVNKLLGTFFDSIKRIGEFVAAGIILKGLEKITEALVNMAKEAFNTAVEFQDLRIRLERFMAIDIAEDKGYNSVTTALREAKEPAQELFGWLSKLAVTTPFDIQDIADTLTMAKTYGFATDEAKKLTESIIDFAAGMGLGGDEMNRVIKALGQMKSLGRVAGQELLQLANAGVPVEDILVKVADNLGITREALEKLRMKGLIPATVFFEAFNEVMGYRFAGAAEVAGKSLKSVMGNIKDLTQNVIGFNIALPIVDAFSGKLNELVEAFTKPEVFDKFWAATERIGDAFKGILQGFFILAGFDASSFAVGIVDWLDELGKKLETVKTAFMFFATGNMSFDELANVIGNVFNIDPEKITKFVDFLEKVAGLPQKIRDIVSAFQEGGFLAGLEEIGVPQPIINFFSWIQSAIENFQYFLEENGPKIMEELQSLIDEILQAAGVEENGPEKSLLEKIGILIWDLSQNLVANGPTITEKLGNLVDSITGEDDFVATLNKIVDWILEHEDTVLEFFANMARGAASLAIIAQIFATASIIISGAVLAIIGAFTSMGITTAEAEENLRAAGYDVGEGIGQEVEAGVTSSMGEAQEELERLLDSLDSSASDSGTSYDNMFNYGYHTAQGFADGIKKGQSLVDAAVSKLNSSVSAATSTHFQLASPSKLYEKYGRQLMEGMEIGIIKKSEAPVSAMTKAIGNIISATKNPVQSSIVNQTTTNNNFNLNVNTQAKAEPVIADFRMLQSLAG